MTTTLYDTCLWRDARSLAIERDAGRCIVSRLLGGSCSAGPLHVHHLIRPEDGGDLYDLDNLGSVCSSHHPQWEALRRYFARQAEVEKQHCPHKHPTREGRLLCESRRSRS